MKNDKAIQIAIELLNMNIFHLPSILDILLFSNAPKLYQYFDGYLKDQRIKLDILTKEKKEEFIILLGHPIFHIIAHVLHDKNDTAIKSLENHIVNVKNMFSAKNIITSIFPAITEFAKAKKFETAYGIINYLKNVFNSELMASVIPFEVALKYIQTKDTDLLEKLHAEYRI